jgi:hypothetical protein
MGQNPYESPSEGGRKGKSLHLPILIFLFGGVVIATVVVFAYLVSLQAN